MTLINEILDELDHEIDKQRKLCQAYDFHYAGSGDPPGIAYQDGKLSGLILAHAIVKGYDKGE